MFKKILCALILGTTAVMLASCGCTNGNTFETAPPKTVEITPEIQIGEYAYYVTYDEWVNEKTGDTIIFNNDGTFEGKIDGESYKGVFTLKVNEEKEEGSLVVGVTLDGEEEKVPYTLDFKTSSEMTLTTDKGASESYVAKWTTED